MRLSSRVCISILLTGVTCATLNAQVRAGFELGPITVAAGEQKSTSLNVPAGVDEGTTIPVTVIHGVRPGPVLALVAGVHGYEYPPISALQNIRRDLDATELSGTVILVHIANLPSFLGRTIYYSPVDGKNLNRVFPGNPDGTLSDRIAHVITTMVIDRADYLVDMHSGDGNEALRPYLYWPITGDTVFDEITKGMALAFGLDHIVVDRARPDSGPSRYTDQTAIRRGIPAITTETGQLGTNDGIWIEMAERGVWNLLRHLEMVPGETLSVGEVIWLEDYLVVRSPATGLFQAIVRDGYVVAEGGLLGYLVDFFGDTTHEIRAPFSGVVNYVVGTPPIKQGEPVAMLSRIR